MIGLEYNIINALGPNIFNNLPSLEFIGLQDNICTNQFFDINESQTIDDVNEALQECFDNSTPEPPRTRQLLFELRGNMTLFNEYNEEILSVEGRPW